MLERIVVYTEAKDLLEMRHAGAFAVGTGAAVFFQGFGAFFARCGEFQGGEVDPAFFAEWDVTFAGCITDGAGAGETEIKYVTRQRGEVHGGIVQNSRLRRLRLRGSSTLIREAASGQAAHL
jgi:hypothetical protein